jgi:hypothetical protein
MNEVIFLNPWVVRPDEKLFVLLASFDLAEYTTRKFISSYFEG